MFNHKLPSDFPMQTLRKKTSPLKYKNEPGRFLGEGVSFRAKLIGVLEVPEARGDRMCQEALADLKMAIRAAGEHKQRIQVHVAIDGLRLRDDKTGDSLYHHPVHKISFIAQDMTDSRAFGYIFGSPDTGHRFFGIKTDKAASQVVIAMRDLFQVVFELKKKEVEMAKQQLESKTVTGTISKPPLTIEAKLKIPRVLTSRQYLFQQLNAPAEASPPKGEAEGGVAELVDLEQELSSLRRGLTQVEGLTPNADPFGDSFTAATAPVASKGLLPPPPGSSRGRAPAASARAVFSPTRATPLDLPVAADFAVDPTPTTDTVAVVPPSVGYDVFTELDPLGTGRSKPYVDKKLFFQELKNPPKKVLKDLVPSAQLAPEKEPKPEGNYGTTTMTSLTRHSGGTVAIVKPPVAFNAHLFESDPFAENDPFDNADPFSSDLFKEDPFSNVTEMVPKTVARDAKTATSRDDSMKLKLTALVKELNETLGTELGGGIVYNGPLQVFLPPEPAPKSPRLSRQNTESSSVRQRPQPSRLSAETASPPPPLPPKKPALPPAVGPPAAAGAPPPRPPHDAHDAEELQDVGPPLPKPVRKKEPKLDRGTKPPRSRECSSGESSSGEYEPRPPPPLPAARRLNITLAQLLTCSMDQLADRLRVPAETLSCMTLPQLTDYLRSYLAADNDRARIHVEKPGKFEKPYTSLTPITTSIDKPPSYNAPPISQPTDIKPQFEDNFTPSVDTAETFVANFDDFDKKVNSSYDKYAAFREIQEQELKSKSILDPVESPNGHVETKIEEEKDEPNITKELTKADQEAERKELSKSPLKSLDELTLDSFNMFRNSVSPKPSQIDAKIEDIKSVMKNLQIEKTSRSATPRETNLSDLKIEDNSDRYAALREITITEPSQDEFESIPPEIPKERKRSDEKSDGFDNSDFFDCIDNSSLSFTHVEEAFRKSPVVKEREEEKKVEEVKKSPKEVMPVRDLQPPVARLSTGSISDVASASSPDTKDKRRAGDRWAVLGAGASPWSSDSRDSDLSPRPRHTSVTPRIVQTSSSSRDVSPWEEEPPRRPPSHSHTRTDSRQNSSGSRECLDSGSGREKDRRRSSRDRERETKDTIRDRRDSGSGRDRRDATHRRRDKRSRDRDIDLDTERDRRRDRERDIDIDERRSRDRDITIDPDRERTYSRDRKERDYRDSRSRERPHQDHRDKERERIRHRKSSRHSYDEHEDYSDGCGSGRSSPRDRWADRWRRDDRNYGSLGWRDSRRRNDRPLGESDRRYGSTVTWSGRRRDDRRRRRTSPRRHDDKRHWDDVTAPRHRDDVTAPRHRDDVTVPRHKDDVTIPRHRDDVTTPRHRDDVTIPRHRDDVTTPRQRDDSANRSRDDVSSGSRHRDDVTSLSRHRDDVTGSKVTQYSDEYSPAPSSGKRKTYSGFEGTRFTFDPEESTASPPSAGPRPQWWWSADSPAAFEDDFTTSASTPRGRNTSIAEEDEDLPPLPPTKQDTKKDIKKSESVNIFTQQSDPFENDAFFACTGSDKAARRDNWPGDFHGFDNA